MEFRALLWCRLATNGRKAELLERLENATKNEAIAQEEAADEGQENGQSVEQVEEENLEVRLIISCDLHLFYNWLVIFALL